MAREEEARLKAEEEAKAKARAMEETSTSIGEMSRNGGRKDQSEEAANIYGNRMQRRWDVDVSLWIFRD